MSREVNDPRNFFWYSVPEECSESRYRCHEPYAQEDLAAGGPEGGGA